MFGPVSTRTAVSRGIQVQIVGNKALSPARQFLLLDHRMPALNHLDVGRLVELRPAIVAQSRNVSQRRQNIDLRQGQRRLPDAPGLSGNCGAQFGKQPPLDLDNLLLRVENLRFVFLQLWRGKTLGVDQRLLAFVICRNQMQVRLWRLPGNSQKSN